ncbi:DUF3631 domain-containing protein [Actinomyces polynesiensis]|uniref:DUF3631 domain-containing protein n=1 Tax=Actinomyces polynesiensis TaxID=1325934 RepID=UPI0006937B44|nr:DUF3631 domain-containing protein [Actinomyces polynesiensis]
MEIEAFAHVGGLDGSDGSGGLDGRVSALLSSVRRWFARYVCVTDDADLDLLTLWAAHTYVVEVTYSTPRLILDSSMPGSGKTTTLEHLAHLCFQPVQAASLSSPALLARILAKSPRTILIDEVDRNLDPKKPGVDELLAVLNSGYKRGATRPVLVPVKGGSWDVEEMPTFGPVAMAGNAPNLPDDTRSRSIRVLLMPDLEGRVEPSDWEDIEMAAGDLREALEQAMEAVRDEIRDTHPTLPNGCVGRMREKWNPLARVAHVAGGEWIEKVETLINRDVAEVEAERADGLTKLPPAVVLIRDLFLIWGEQETFLRTPTMVSRLIDLNPEMWGEGSAYGRALTVQRLGRMLSQGAKVHSGKVAGERGYTRASFVTVWGRMGIGVTVQTAQTVRTVQTAQVQTFTECRTCGLPAVTADAKRTGYCAQHRNGEAS